MNSFARHFLLFLAVSHAVSAAAFAAPAGAKTDDDDPAINAQGVSVNRVLRVLRSNPDSASDSCIHALEEMHQAQDQLGRLEKRDNDPDTDIARDVLASDMEDAATMCGADARRLCRASPATDGILAQACAALPFEGD